MSRLLTALRSLTDDCSGADLAEILGIPKRTADRWLAELRTGDADNWHAGAIETLALHEAVTWGTTRLADALLPEAYSGRSTEKADADRLAKLLPVIVSSHLVNTELLSTVAADLADGVLQDHEARALLPLVQKAQTATMEKHRALTKLEQLLENRLSR